MKFYSLLTALITNPFTLYIPFILSLNSCDRLASSTSHCKRRSDAYSSFKKAKIRLQKELALLPISSVTRDPYVESGKYLTIAQQFYHIMALESYCDPFPLSNGFQILSTLFLPLSRTQFAEAVLEMAEHPNLIKMFKEVIDKIEKAANHKKSVCQKLFKYINKSDIVSEKDLIKELDRLYKYILCDSAKSAIGRKKIEDVYKNSTYCYDFSVDLELLEKGLKPLPYLPSDLWKLVGSFLGTELIVRTTKQIYDETPKQIISHILSAKGITITYYPPSIITNLYYKHRALFEMLKQVMRAFTISATAYFFCNCLLTRLESPPFTFYPFCLGLFYPILLALL